MPVCPNCDSEEFELLDGLYFCQVCNVQSQDVIEEEIDEAGAIITNKMRKTKKARKVKGSNDCQNKGKPWYSVEGFQVILKSQVDALIRLGCAPELSEVVKQIWLKYIHVNGVAVIDPTIKALRKPLEASTTFRDRYLSGALGKKCLKRSVFPSIDNQYLKIRFSSKAKLGKRRFKDISSESDSDIDETRKKVAKTKRIETAINEDRPWKSDEEWFSLASDNISSSSSEVSATSSKSLPLSLTSNKDKAKKGKQKATSLACERRKAPIVDLPSLVVILNIALQWRKEPVTIGDLINWIRQGYLPYIDSIKSLLPHMKLTDHDRSHLKTSCIPSYKKISRKTKTMLEFLKIPSSLPDVDVRQLVARYVIELNLPFSLCAFVDCLMSKSNFTYKRRRSDKISLVEIYQPELAAVALIIISMKLLFGLDDEREWMLDDFTSKCVPHGDDCRPFSWKEWSGFHLKRWMEKRRNPKHCFEAIDPEAIEDVHPYVEHWKNVILHSGSTLKEVGGNRCTSTKSKKEALEIKRRAFTKLCDLQGSSGEMERRKHQRQYPYVMPTPSKEDAMSTRCIRHVVDALETRDLNYVWYSDRFSRMETCFQRQSAIATSSLDSDAFSQGEMDFHFSYDFLLSLAREVTASSKILVHSMTSSLERILICPYLVQLDRHKYTSTTWSQAIKATRCQGVW